MNYTFSFGLSSAIGYPIDFYTKLNDTYTMYFWGFELIEIARCVSKYVELSSIEKRSIISKLVVASRVFSKYKERDKVEDTRSIDKTDMKLLSNVVIPTKIVVSILIDSIYESSSASLRFDMFKSSTNALTNPLLKDVEPELVKEIYTCSP
jgi:hypothetical protein